MVELRRNHSSGKRGQSSSRIARLTFFLVFLVISIVVLGYLYSKRDLGSTYIPVNSSRNQPIQSNNTSQSSRPYHAAGSGLEIVDHTYYSLGYNEQAEQAAWVAYPLTAQSIYVPNVKRTNWFSFDTLVSTHSAAHRDYKGSGYTRGHLAPAGDMAFNRQAMEESFMMSNMSPQLRAFNNGIWKELEENVRDWAVKRKSVYIVTGPILTNVQKTIGKNNTIAVPSAFYKIILDLSDPVKEAVAFVIPHRKCDERIQEFAVSIDSVEVLTGLDFFAHLNEAIPYESSFDIHNWNFDEKKYQARIKKWNYE